MITFFALCGGAFGGILLTLGTIVFALIMQAGTYRAADVLSSLFYGTIIFGGWGAFMGFPASLIGGAVYAFLPQALRRIWVAGLIGALASLIYAAVLSLPVNALLTMTCAGAGAGLACAAIARKFGIDGYKATTRLPQ